MAINDLGNASPDPATSTSARIDRIRSTIVLDHERMTFLPRVFGRRLMIVGEAAVFNWMAQLCPEYCGGYWDFVDLSNGGFYLRLKSDKHFAVCVEGNGFCDAMSADAASITATLFAVNALLFKGAEQLHDPFYALRDYAREHAESRSILSAID